MADLISRKALLEELDKWINPCVNYDKSEFLSGIATALVRSKLRQPLMPLRWCMGGGFSIKNSGRGTAQTVKVGLEVE